jgi:nucleoside phosphorylase
MQTNLIWLLAAFRLEKKALEKALKIVNKQEVTVHTNIEVRLTGVGIRKSRITLEKYLEKQKPDLVLITGIAGAVHPGLKVGDIIFPEKVCLVDGVNKIQKLLDVKNLSGNKFRERLENKKRAYTTPVLATVMRTYHPNDKKSLRKVNPDIYAVDMESYSLVEVLTKSKIPFVFFRVISDSYNMKFPKDAFIDALFCLKGVKRIILLFCSPISSFRIVRIIPSMLKSLRRLKECSVEFISSVVKPKAE